MNESAVHVGVELGGTKIVVAASVEGPELVSRDVIATGNPEPTLTSVREAIASIARSNTVRGIGVASFGPIDIRQTSSTYGRILQTPKPRWSGVDVLSEIATAGVDVTVDTDVNAAVLAEHVWGAGTTENLLYLTVGTGIGGAIWSAGGVLRGANHSEIGHIRVPRHPGDVFTGSCPFHGDCLEGMASGTSIRQRWGLTAERPGVHAHDMLQMEAWYLAHAIASLCAVIPVEEVIIGGGVAKMAGFHSAVADELPAASAGYPAVPFTGDGPMVLPPGLGDDAGVVGAIELARAASGS